MLPPKFKLFPIVTLLPIEQFVPIVNLPRILPEPKTSKLFPIVTEFVKASYI